MVKFPTEKRELMLESGNKSRKGDAKKKKEQPLLQPNTDQATKELQNALSLDTLLNGSLTVLNSVTDLIQDQKALSTIADFCSQGASMETVEGALGIESGQLKQWLRIGKSEKNGPYRALYLFYSRINASTRLLAESCLLSKSPKEWLDRVEFQNVLTSEEPKTPKTLEGKTSNNDPVQAGPMYIDSDEFK